MAEARQEVDWNHTAALLAMLVNVNRSKGRPAKPAEFHPIHTARAAKRPPIQADIRMLKRVFVDRP